MTERHGSTVDDDPNLHHKSQKNTAYRAAVDRVAESDLPAAIAIEDLRLLLVATGRKFQRRAQLAETRLELAQCGRCTDCASRIIRGAHNCFPPDTTDELLERARRVLTPVPTSSTLRGTQ